MASSLDAYWKVGGRAWRLENPGDHDYEVREGRRAESGDTPPWVSSWVREGRGQGVIPHVDAVNRTPRAVDLFTRPGMSRMLIKHSLEQFSVSPVRTALSKSNYRVRSVLGLKERFFNGLQRTLR